MRADHRGPGSVSASHSIEHGLYIALQRIIATRIMTASIREWLRARVPVARIDAACYTDLRSRRRVATKAPVDQCVHFPYGCAGIPIARGISTNLTSMDFVTKREDTRSLMPTITRTVSDHQASVRCWRVRACGYKLYDFIADCVRRFGCFARHLWRHTAEVRRPWLFSFFFGVDLVVFGNWQTRVAAAEPSSLILLLCLSRLLSAECDMRDAVGHMSLHCRLQLVRYHRP